jgi:hypothetical protein
MAHLSSPVPAWVNLTEVTTDTETAARAALADRAREFLPAVVAWVRDALPLLDGVDLGIDDGPTRDAIETAIGFTDLANVSHVLTQLGSEIDHSAGTDDTSGIDELATKYPTLFGTV